MTPLILVDYSQLCHYARMSTKNKDMTLTIISSLKMIINKFRTNNLVLCADVSGSRYRKALAKSMSFASGESAKEYKAQRIEARAKLSATDKKRLEKMFDISPIILEVLEDSFFIAKVDGVEADDIISLLYQDLGGLFDISIVSSDKDLLQIGAKQYNPFGFSLLTPEEKFGIAKEQIPLYLALVGDTVDNIQGVPGCGEVTARGMINKYGTLEEMFRFPPEQDAKYGKFLAFIQANPAYMLKTLDLVTVFTDYTKLTNEEETKIKSIKDTIMFGQRSMKIKEDVLDKHDMFEYVEAFQTLLKM